MVADISEQFDVMVTGACNARCGFCVQEATFKSTYVADEQFLGGFERHFAWFYELGGRKVVITGGEPLLAVPRVLGVLERLAQFPSLELKALYTNGSRLLHQMRSNGTRHLVVEELARAGLGSVNLSVHHFRDDINNAILRVQKPDTEVIVREVRRVGLPFRLNLTAQKGGVQTLDELFRYIEWGFKLGAADIYIRELFQFAFSTPLAASDRNPLEFSRSNRIAVRDWIDSFGRHPSYEMVEEQEERLREKTEWCFRHKPTGRDIFVSTLSIGTEKNGGSCPYLVLMPDGNLYRGWLGSQHLVADIQGVTQCQRESS